MRKGSSLKETYNSITGRRRAPGGAWIGSRKGWQKRKKAQDKRLGETGPEDRRTRAPRSQRAGTQVH